MIILAACGETADSQSSVTISGESIVTESAETLSDAEARLLVDDNLPNADYGGYEFRLVIQNNTDDSYIFEEETGDIIENAEYRRNLAVEEGWCPPQKTYE